MILLTAILKSDYNIATRRKMVANTDKQKVRKYEYHMASAGTNGHVHIFNGRTGTIRRANAYDQSVDDWEPFAAYGNYAKKVRLKMDTPKARRKKPEVADDVQSVKPED